MQMGVPIAEVQAVEFRLKDATRPANVYTAQLTLRDGTVLLAYPTDRPAWSRLCRLLTEGKRRTGKGGCDLDWDDLSAGGEGLLYILVPDQPDARLQSQLTRLAADAPGRAYLAGTIRRRPGDQTRLHRLATMGAAAARGADHVIITDDNPRGEDPAAIRAAIRAACPDATEIGDRAAAIAAGLAMLRPGDVLAVAGKGHEPGQTIGGVTLPFDDADTVRRLAGGP